MLESQKVRYIIGTLVDNIVGKTNFNVNVRKLESQKVRFIIGTLVDNSSSGSCRSFHCKIFQSDICRYLYLVLCSLENDCYSL